MMHPYQGGALDPKSFFEGIEILNLCLYKMFETLILREREAAFMEQFTHLFFLNIMKSV